MGFGYGSNGAGGLGELRSDPTTPVMPPRATDSMANAMRLDSDINRISEKISGLGLAGRREYELRRENEKVKHEDVGMAKRIEESLSYGGA